jgi:hypothetical protein
MKRGWLTKTIGGRTIEHVPCPNPGGAVEESAPPTGVIHTIEGGLDSGLGVFRQHFAPHFTLDAERVIQLVPLGTMAAALENHAGGVETNAIARVQIEVAGHSREHPWCCDPPLDEALADLLATLEQAAEIPLERPFDDAMPPLPWASYTFERRAAGKWGKVPGWYGHVEVPENEHWDPGAFEWTTILTRARQMAGAPTPEPDPHPTPAAAPKPLPPWFWVWLAWFLGEGDFKEIGRHVAAQRPADAPEKIPSWAWVKAGQFVAARDEPHGHQHELGAHEAGPN